MIDPVDVALANAHEAIRQAVAGLGIGPEEHELAELARQILEPVEPLEYEVHPADEGEGEWWLAGPAAGWTMPGWAYEARDPYASLRDEEYDYREARGELEARVRLGLPDPGEPSTEWWHGCLEGIRIGIALGRRTAQADPIGLDKLPPRPVLPGLRTR
jgi:hypothetical protein